MIKIPRQSFSARTIAARSAGKGTTSSIGRIATFFGLAMLAAAVIAGLAFAQSAKLKKAKGQIQSKRMGARKAVAGKPQKGEELTLTESIEDAKGGGKVIGPVERRLVKAHEFNGDLRKLPRTPPRKVERPEREEPEFEPITLPEPPGLNAPKFSSSAPKAPAVAAPTPIMNFDGLDFNTWGAGHPPDTNGDVGPNHYIETVNTSIGIYNKSGTQLAAFTFDTFMSQGSFGNLCDTDNFGDPVVLYDTFEDRWVITDFAFQLGGGGNIVNPPGSFQCFAVSKTGDPVAGGWNYYSIQITDLLNDYPKLGVWPDGIYMNSNMFGFGALSASFAFSRQWVFNKAQMYAGAANPQIVTFDAPRVDGNGGAVVTIIPSNARLQVGTPPPGTPNYFVGTSTYTNAVAVWKFHVDWANVFNSTFTGVTTVIQPSAWASPPATVPSLGGNALDTLATRSMMQNQYTNFAGVESIWQSHTIRGTGGATHAAVRWYQTDVTGGTIAANVTQGATHSPDTTVNRFMPSLAIDRAGDMMIGYSASNATMKPAIRYAGRLVGDPINTLPQTEVDLIQGTGTQVGTCGGTCTRWGDYSAMTLDPTDGCTFWYTQEYYATDGLNDLTRIGSFRFPGCTSIGNGTVSGTVTTNPGGLPIGGATVSLGSRTTTTIANGTYSFTNLPAGTYPSISAGAQGFNSATTTSVVVPDGGTSTNDFALTSATQSSCFVDTTQSDFSIGAPVSLDLTTSSGDVSLSRQNLNQIQAAFGGSGVGITITTWGGQTFTPNASGLLTRADINLFCSGCTGTIPNLTLSVQATSGGLPTGPDLASTTIPGFASGAAIFYTGNFASPVAVTSGTQYALVIRPTANPSLGTYALTRTGSTTVGEDIYSGGARVVGATSGTVWTAPTTGGITTDAPFRIFLTTPSGSLVSSVKDNNPAVGNFPHWSQITWTATVPANTSLQFQVAGSNNPAGPFNFVGPDGTAATFYTTSPGSLFQFNTLRYLKYKAFFATTDPAVSATLNDVSLCFSSSPTAAPANISGRIATAEGTPLPGVALTLNGARSAVTITDENGFYQFDSVDTDNFYTVTPSLVNYHFSPANRSFSLVANKTDAVFTAVADAAPSGNAIDGNEYFVRQQYRDFLGREPDQNGLAFWTGKLSQCSGDATCLRAARVEVSAAFFESREFNEGGSFVFRLYQSGLGRQLSYDEFSSDRQHVVGGIDLDARKTALANSFVIRAEFVQRYQGKATAESFVDALLQSVRTATGLDLAGERTDLLNRYNEGGTMTDSRTLVVRSVADNAAFSSAMYNPSFVAMEYFGYLRRGAEPDGYAFWLNALNRSGASSRAMVCSFLTSTEYQRRFGTVVTHSNAECRR